MKLYKTLLSVLMCFLLIGCSAGGDSERDILTIHSQTPITKIEGIIDNSLTGIVSATVTITWIYLYSGETRVNIEIEEVYDNEADAEKAWEVRREAVHLLTHTLSGNTYRYENINQLDKSYNQLREIVENLDGWEIVAE